MPVEERFILQLKGKSFVLFAGLLDLAHAQGLKGIETEVVMELSDPKEQRWVVRAIGTFRTGDGEAVWSAYADADPQNSQMRGAYLRHAETRSIARMLRMATNVGMTAFEELGPDPEPEPARQPPADERCCLWPGCGVPITAKEQALSQERFGKNLCPRHAEELAKIRAKKAEAASG